MKSVLVHIAGRVQGVGYRVWTQTEARRHGLDGWVRNRRDGSVETLIAGPDAAVEEMLQRFWQGPPSAQVRTVTSEPAAFPARRGFDMLPTV